MKRSARITALVSLLAAAPAAEAFHLGARVSYFHYEEPGLMVDKGFLFGAALLGDIPLPLGLGIYSELAGSWGPTTYEGHLQNINTGELTPYSTSDQNFLWNADLGLRLRFALGTLGVGVRGGLRTYGVRNSQEGTGAYDRDITQFYLPVGFELFVRSGAAHVMGLRYTHSIFLSGRVVSHLEMINSGYSTAVNSQSTGKAFEIEAYVEPMANKNYSFSIRYTDHRIDDSDVVTIATPSGAAGAKEPANRTRLTALTAGYRF